MRYTIYDFIDYSDGVFTPSDLETTPTRVSPKKDLIIRPFEEIILVPNGEVPEIIYWDSSEKNIPLLKEVITYERDNVGLKTKGLAKTQTKTLMWYYHDDNDGVYKIDNENTKVLEKNYVDGAVSDSLGNLLPTPAQMREWKRKSENAISYMLTREVAGTPIDQAVFQLFDNIMFSIQKWQNNPVSSSFKKAIENKDGGFELQVAPDVFINIWDIDISKVPPKVITLQQFLLGRLDEIV